MTHTRSGRARRRTARGASPARVAGVFAFAVVFGAAAGAFAPDAAALAPADERAAAWMPCPAAEAPALRCPSGGRGAPDPLGPRPSASRLDWLVVAREPGLATTASSASAPTASAPLARWTLRHATSTSLP